MPDHLAVPPGTFYDSNVAAYQRLLEEIRFTVEKALPTDLKIHTATGRVKKREDYLEKIKRKAYVNADSDVEDIVGFRIVCLFIDDLDRLRNIVESQFMIIDSTDHVAGDEPDRFGYMSQHYICRLRPDLTGPRYEDLLDFKFEVQCRTIAMDAWANISHYLAYKGEEAVPANLRRDFSALSGLFYVADQQFQQLATRTIHVENESETRQAQDGDRNGISVDSASVLALLRRTYPNRQEATREDAAELAHEVNVQTEIRDIAQLETILLDNDSEVQMLEIQRPPVDRETDLPTTYASVGAARSALGIEFPNFKVGRNVKRS